MIGYLDQPLGLAEVMQKRSPGQAPWIRAQSKILFSVRALLHHSGEREIPLTAEKSEGREKSGGCNHGEERTSGSWAAEGGVVVEAAELMVFRLGLGLGIWGCWGGAPWPVTLRRCPGRR
jgi:hypothetical protein